MFQECCRYPARNGVGPSDIELACATASGDSPTVGHFRHRCRPLQHQRWCHARWPDPNSTLHQRYELVRPEPLRFAIFPRFLLWLALQVFRVIEGLVFHGVRCGPNWFCICPLHPDHERPITSQNLANCESLPTATKICPSLAAKASYGTILGCAFPRRIGAFPDVR